MDFLAYLGLSGGQTGGKGDMFEVTFPEKRPLGMKVAIRAVGDDTTAEAETAIIVVALPRSAEKPDLPGMVEATGMVKIGDELVAVNAQLVPTEDFAAATALIQAAPWPLTLRFRRPPPGAPLARPLTGAAAEAAWTAALRSPGPDGDARRAAAVRSVALGGGTGGELVLLSVQARAALAARNRAVIRAAQGMDAPLQRAFNATNQRAEGAQALADELVRLPTLRKEVRECTEQVLDLGDSIARVEALLADRELANQSFAERSDVTAGQEQHDTSNRNITRADTSTGSSATRSNGSRRDSGLPEGTTTPALEAATLVSSTAPLPASSFANEEAVPTTATATVAGSVAVGGRGNNNSRERSEGNNGHTVNRNESKEDVVGSLDTNAGATDLPLGAELSAMVGSIAKVEELLAQQQAQRRLAASRDDDDDDDDGDDDNNDADDGIEDGKDAAVVSGSSTGESAGSMAAASLPSSLPPSSSSADVPLPHAPPPLFGADEDDDEEGDDRSSSSSEQAAHEAPLATGNNNSQDESAEVTAALAALLGPNGSGISTASDNDVGLLGSKEADAESEVSDII